MDRSLGYLLEIGVAFMLFVFALSTFFGMQNNLMAFQQEGHTLVEQNKDVELSDVETTPRYLSKEALYFVLTENSHLGSGNWLGEGGYTSTSTGIDIYIDEVLYPVVSDYSGSKSLELALRGLTATEFEAAYVVDTSGVLMEIHYTGR